MDLEVYAYGHRVSLELCNTSLILQDALILDDHTTVGGRESVLRIYICIHILEKDCFTQFALQPYYYRSVV